MTLIVKFVTNIIHAEISSKKNFLYICRRERELLSTMAEFDINNISNQASTGASTPAQPASAPAKPTIRDIFEKQLKREDLAQYGDDVLAMFDTFNKADENGVKDNIIDQNEYNAYLQQENPTSEEVSEQVAEEAAEEAADEAQADAKAKQAPPAPATEAVVASSGAVESPDEADESDDAAQSNDAEESSDVSGTNEESDGGAQPLHIIKLKEVKPLSFMFNFNSIADSIVKRFELDKKMDNSVKRFDAVLECLKPGMTYESIADKPLLLSEFMKVLEFQEEKDVITEEGLRKYKEYKEKVYDAEFKKSDYDKLLKRYEKMEAQQRPDADASSRFDFDKVEDLPPSIIALIKDYKKYMQEGNLNDLNELLNKNKVQPQQLTKLLIETDDKALKNNIISLLMYRQINLDKATTGKGVTDFKDFRTTFNIDENSYESAGSPKEKSKLIADRIFAQMNHDLLSGSQKMKSAMAEIQEQNKYLKESERLDDETIIKIAYQQVVEEWLANVSIGLQNAINSTEDPEEKETLSFAIIEVISYEDKALAELLLSKGINDSKTKVGAQTIANTAAQATNMDLGTPTAKILASQIQDQIDESKLGREVGKNLVQSVTRAQLSKTHTSDEPISQEEINEATNNSLELLNSILSLKNPENHEYVQQVFTQAAEDLYSGNVQITIEDVREREPSHSPLLYNNTTSSANKVSTVTNSTNTKQETLSSSRLNIDVIPNSAMNSTQEKNSVSSYNTLTPDEKWYGRDSNNYSTNSIKEQAARFMESRGIVDRTQIDGAIFRASNKFMQRMSLPEQIRYVQSEVNKLQNSNDFHTLVENYDLVDPKFKPYVENFFRKAPVRTLVGMLTSGTDQVQKFLWNQGFVVADQIEPYLKPMPKEELDKLSDYSKSKLVDFFAKQNNESIVFRKDQAQNTDLLKYLLDND